jgi:hypothetical protein
MTLLSEKMHHCPNTTDVQSTVSQDYIFSVEYYKTKKTQHCENKKAISGLFLFLAIAFFRANEFQRLIKHNPLFRKSATGFKLRF